MYTYDKNEWEGWMIFRRQGTQVGLVPSSFGLNKRGVELALEQRNKPGEFVARVTLIKED